MLEVSYADFDTACYNLQYNVMQLVKHCVGIVIEVNSQSTRIDAVDQKVTGLYDIQVNMQSIMENMNQTMGLLNQQVSNTNGQLAIVQNDIYNINQDINTIAGQMTNALTDITDLQRRVSALEGR